MYLSTLWLIILLLLKVRGSLQTEKRCQMQLFNEIFAGPISFNSWYGCHLHSRLWMTLTVQQALPYQQEVVLSPQWMPKTKERAKCYVFSYIHTPFLLRGTRWSFSLAYLHGQHPYSCAVGPLLIGVTWTHALRYYNSRSNNWDGYQVTEVSGMYTEGTRDTGMIHIPGGTWSCDSGQHMV